MSASQEEHIFHRIFGLDLDAYLNANVEKLEESKKRWTNCSLEEWQKGGEGAIGFPSVSYRLHVAFYHAELGEKFGKILDFVRTSLR